MPSVMECTGWKLIDTPFGEALTWPEPGDEECPPFRVGIVCTPIPGEWADEEFAGTYDWLDIFTDLDDSNPHLGESVGWPLTCHLRPIQPPFDKWVEEKTIEVIRAGNMFYRELAEELADIGLLEELISFRLPSPEILEDRKRRAEADAEADVKASAFRRAMSHTYPRD